MIRTRDGFTVIEVVVAILILTIGIIALAGTAAMATRMIGQGQRYTEAAQMANKRFEILRASPCDSLTGGSATSGAYSESWTVTAVGLTGVSFQVVIQAPRGGGGFRSDTFSSTRFC